MTTRDMHDDCLAACAWLWRQHPEEAAIFEARRPVDRASPAGQFMAEYLALSRVAESFSLGNRASAADHKRARAVIARMKAVPVRG